VRVAESGIEAAAACTQEPFDLVLMDLQMPEMDGLQTTTEIRKWEESRGAHTPIVGLTAHALKGDRERCLAAGRDAYLTKPVNRHELQQVLELLFPPRPGETGSSARLLTPPAQPAAGIDRGGVLARLEGDEQLQIADRSVNSNPAKFERKNQLPDPYS